MPDETFELAALIGKTLLDRGWQITCAESCTGGGVGYAITSTPGSSAWFRKGFITYSNEAKQEMLNVSSKTLTEYGAVSSETVKEMALGAAIAANAELAISVSGIAGPDGGSPEKPVGTVWFGFAVCGEVVTHKLKFSGDRQAVRIKAIEFALSNILKLLTK
ncbi:nicotinamide-nucleotide amidase [uncultured Paraglaciecola sp.]|uniref:nicotinamide-nucleotide amidase n=1 Tax=uncultured Paraglaciecola sp. TaxID=1765024 RepID=UPI00259A8663|nr:nicotinamide-nucleotide amidase [uncultured Paraglaciecola sp.]